MNKIKISASILSADFSDLKSEIKKACNAGVDSLHIDVMDGHFVENITMGPCIVESVKKITELPQWIHLMVEDPLRFLKPFALSGADALVFHIESVNNGNVKKIIDEIKNLGCKAGIALNPDTDEKCLFPYFEVIDMILVMSVYPGFSGQKFIPDVLYKVKNIREKYSGCIGIDGGLNKNTAKQAIQAGADMIAAASYIFKACDMKQAVKDLRGEW